MSIQIEGAVVQGMVQWSVALWEEFDVVWCDTL